MESVRPVTSAPKSRASVRPNPPQPSPTRPYVEHTVAGSEQELGGEVALLLLLTLLERLLSGHEVTAGVLAVSVEEEFVEAVGKIVVMGHIPARAGGMVVLVNPPHERPEPFGQTPQRVGERLQSQRSEDKIQKVPERPLLDGEALLHEGLPGLELGIEQQPPSGSPVVDADGDARPPPIPVGLRIPFPIDDPERSVPDELPEERIEHAAGFPRDLPPMEEVPVGCHQTPAPREAPVSERFHGATVPDYPRGRP